MSMKTNKAYTKRLKVTRNGKIIARKPGQNHFNAKESGRFKQTKRKGANLVIPHKDKSRYLVGF